LLLVLCKGLMGQMRSVRFTRVIVAAGLGSLSLVGVLVAPAGAASVEVAPGQNLTTIANTYGISVAELVAANGIANPNYVQAGSWLTIPSSAASSDDSTTPPPGSSVVVAVGDTLSAIALRVGTTIEALAQANGIVDPNFLLAGTVLQVPGSSAASAGGAAQSIVVQPGETLAGLAARYGTTVAALASANGIANPNHLIAGARLLVPSANAAPMALAAYQVPDSSALPPQLLANPQRLTLLPVFVHWAGVFSVPAPLLEALCWWESGWQSSVISPTGAIGIGQLEGATVDEVRQQLADPNLNPYVPSDNIEMAAAFLHDLLSSTAGNASLALAGYYQGLASVEQAGLFPSTRQYVQGILAYSAWFS
jgi:LysM repeat protein